MKKIMAVMLLALVAGTSWLMAASDLDFVLVNKTGWRIDKVFLSPTGVDSWGKDILGATDVFEPNTQLKIVFHPESEAELWDLLCVEPDGTKHEYHKLNLTKIEKITLFYSDAKGAYATWE